MECCELSCLCKDVDSRGDTDKCRFALEEVSYYFPPKVMWKSFFTAAIAAVVLKTLNPLGTGKLVLLETNFQTTWHIMQLPLFIFIGIFGGLYGALFCYLNIAWTKSFRRTSFIAASPVFECAVVCLLTTMLSCGQFLSYAIDKLMTIDWNEWTFLGGIELLSRLLQECAPGESSALCASETPDYSLIIGSLVAALIIKIALTIVTFGVCATPNIAARLTFVDPSTCGDLYPDHVYRCVVWSNRGGIA